MTFGTEAVTRVGSGVLDSMIVSTINLRRYKTRNVTYMDSNAGAAKANNANINLPDISLPTHHHFTTENMTVGLQGVRSTELTRMGACTYTMRKFER